MSWTCEKCEWLGPQIPTAWPWHVPQKRVPAALLCTCECASGCACWTVLSYVTGIRWATQHQQRWLSRPQNSHHIHGTHMMFMLLLDRTTGMARVWHACVTHLHMAVDTGMPVCDTLAHACTWLLTLILPLSLFFKRAIQEGFPPSFLVGTLIFFVLSSK